MRGILLLLLLLPVAVSAQAPADGADDKKDAARFFYRAMGKRMVRKYTEAAELFRKALALDQEAGLYWHWQGKTELYNLEKPEQAVISLSNAAVLMPDNPWTLFHLGEAVLREGNPARAAAIWERAFAWYRARRLLPEYELYLKLGRVRRDRLGQPAAAEAVFREGSVRYPDRVHLLIELSGVTALLGRAKEARRLVRQALRLAEKHYMKIPAWADRDAAVVLRWRLKDPRAALAHLEQAVRRHPDEPFLRMQAAYAWNDLGRYDRAVAAALQALERYERLSDPGYRTHYHYLAALLQDRLGDHARALVWLQRAEAKYPGDAETHLRLARALEQTGQHAARARHLREYINLTVIREQIPPLAVYTALAELYRTTLKQPEEARLVLEDGLRFFGKEPGLHLLLGQVLEELGRSKEALAAYREAVRLYRAGGEGVPQRLPDRIKKLQDAGGGQ